MRSSASRPPACADPTCTCMTVMAPFMTPGDILGHEPMGIVQEIGSEITNLRSATGSSCRSTSPAAIASCANRACNRNVRRRRSTSTVCGAALFGYTKLYGQVPGGQAEFLRVPHADYGPVKVPQGRL